MKRLLLIGIATLLAVGVFAQNPAETPESRLAAIQAVKNPDYDEKRESEEGYFDNVYMKGLTDAAKERARLILLFYKDFPSNPEARKLMNQRWEEMQEFRNPPSAEAIEHALDDIDAFLKQSPSPEMTNDAKYWAAFYGMYGGYSDTDKMIVPVERFAKEYPKDPRAISLLSRIADFTSDPEKKVAIYRRIIKTFPEARSSRFAKGKVRQHDELGKPFALSFEDAISGKDVSIPDLKGKIVILDFWATWCGPCVAEMPEMKKLYAEYHSKGVEILGISLDNKQGGLDALKNYVVKNDVAWPQYYQGDGWESKFSMEWGINSIPALFIIDQKGNLVNVNGRGQLEKEIKRLLAK